MLPRKIKQLYYVLACPFMYANGIFFRYYRSKFKKLKRVHLGPGQKNYINNWLNLDANMFTAKCDVWIDLKNKLPFPDSTVECFYSHHVIEHLPDIYSHFVDVYRCLKPGGVYRVGGPNGDSAIAKFLSMDKEWFSDFPDKRESIGGRFENFIFCRGEHLSILTFSMLQEFLVKAGFNNVKLCIPHKETNYPELFSECLLKENETDYEIPHTLIVEAVKM